jgi:hypothetical protein
MTPRDAKIEDSRKAKALKLAAVLREAMADGTLTLDDVRTRDTGIFWQIVTERAGVRPPSKRGEGMWRFVSPETRVLVLKLLEEPDGKP